LGLTPTTLSVLFCCGGVSTSVPNLFARWTRFSCSDASSFEPKRSARFFFFSASVIGPGLSCLGVFESGIGSLISLDSICFGSTFWT